MNSSKRKLLAVIALLAILVVGVYLSLSSASRSIDQAPAATNETPISNESLKAIEQNQNQGDEQSAPEE